MEKSRFTSNYQSIPNGPPSAPRFPPQAVSAARVAKQEPPGGFSLEVVGAAREHHLTDPCPMAPWCHGAHNHGMEKNFSRQEILMV